MKAKRCRSPKKRSHKAKSSLLAGYYVLRILSYSLRLSNPNVTQNDQRGRAARQRVRVQAVHVLSKPGPLQAYLGPPQEGQVNEFCKDSTGGKKSVQERPGRHSMNLSSNNVGSEAKGHDGLANHQALVSIA
eukprot:1384075-Amorphochlora_amoeboformis.AAC.1